MTRSHKANDRDHSLINNAPATPHEQLSRFFTKSGPVDADPRKTKKNGGGKRNWGRSGDEVQDYDYTLTNARRYSNSSARGIGEFRTKFETTELEPVFKSNLHEPLNATSAAGGDVASKHSSIMNSSKDNGVHNSST
ncbi:hypothetical protein P170DRAFT_70825 [Aspergillus steynii IBT 23096]|uniref:Uncharacterized protein n=1 Tax=Aspergillus steynii IBT 23096 TaxID=1392250 RepID=A0A2I2FTZ8_9EURO|nr:uncharacterized protein P170DRAFT_70825 [Aspergillus steynii IBT 23096]PLB44086.1 hypothetical protein P170DRAFT_70825 [Aspergillus steynii IBT 23096]